MFGGNRLTLTKNRRNYTATRSTYNNNELGYQNADVYTFDRSVDFTRAVSWSKGTRNFIAIIVRNPLKNKEETFVFRVDEMKRLGSSPNYYFGKKDDLEFHFDVNKFGLLEKLTIVYNTMIPSGIEGNRKRIDTRSLPEQLIYEATLPENLGVPLNSDILRNRITDLMTYYRMEGKDSDAAKFFYDLDEAILSHIENNNLEYGFSDQSPYSIKLNEEQKNILNNEKYVLPSENYGEAFRDSLKKYKSVGGVNRVLNVLVNHRLAGTDESTQKVYFDRLACITGQIVTELKK